MPFSRLSNGITFQMNVIKLIAIDVDQSETICEKYTSERRKNNRFVLPNQLLSTNFMSFFESRLAEKKCAR